jgi:hypothetical protein
MRSAEKMYEALQVFVKDHKISDWLEKNDPKALEQAMLAPSYLTSL